MTVDSPQGPVSVLSLTDLGHGPNGGWVAAGAVRLPSGFSREVILGAPSVDAAPRVYLETRAERPSARSGSIAYLSRSTATGPFDAYLDGAPLVQVGDAVGFTGLSWENVTDLSTANDGRVFVRGEIGPTAATGGAVAVYPSAEVLLRGGTTVPGAGTTDPITFISAFEHSPSGDHWATRVRVTPPGRSILVVDGAAYRFPTGELAMSGEPLPAAARWNGATVWDDFVEVFVNDTGDVVFRGTAGGEDAVFRNGRFVRALPLTSQDDGIVAIDDRGFAVTGHRLDFLPLLTSVAGEPLRRPYLEGVDVDDDGLIDPGWNPSQGFILGVPPILTDEGRLLSLVSSSTPTGLAFAVMESTLLQGSVPVCDASANTVGGGAHLRAAGSIFPGYDDLTLTAIDLPRRTLVLPLLSRTASSPIQPPGSAGSLCLSAPTRGLSLVTQADLSGNVSIRLPLGALPGPGGTAPVVPGDTWVFQLWYRDVTGGTVTNFSEAIALTFR
ncbi:MAG: hypothetical protein AAF957_28465 [Planctomycetota bacterium]